MGSVGRRRSVGLAGCVLAVVLAIASAAQAEPERAPSKPVVTGADYQGFASSGSTGGARVTVTGRHFQHVRSVRFGSVEGTHVSVRSSRTLLVTAPAHAIDEVHVRVTTKAGTSHVTSGNAWDFQQRNALAGGSVHSCQVLAPTHTVRCWGYGQDGELGNGATADAARPVAVSGLRHAVSIAAGRFHSCALTASGGVYCWGDNTHGQLGNGTTTSSSSPSKVLGLGARALDVAGGGYFTCAVLVGNRVACWGSDVEGQLGDGTTVDRSAPETIRHLSSVVDVGGGFDFACAVRSGGSAFCWGDNDGGQLGDGTVTTSGVPVQVVGLSKAVAISPSAETSTCALTRTGAVRCWGYGRDGELGDGAAASSSRPVTVRGITHATSVTAGAFHFCALERGEVRCWGDNSEGQLGDGSMTQANTPTQVAGTSRVTAIGAGAGHSLAVVSGGATRAWGLNSKGQLGNGTTTTSSVPVPVG